jgi:cell division protein FtsW
MKRGGRKIKKRKKDEKKQVDMVLLIVILMLLTFGLVAISSAGVVVAQQRFGDEYYFFKHQLLFGLLPGLLVFFVFQKIPYIFWRKAALPFFVISLTALLLVFIPGIGIELQGARRWINLGITSFQPAEMMKLALVMYLAFWMEKRGEHLKDWKEGFLPFMAIIGLVGLLIILQPDVGTLGVICWVALVMFFLAGVPWRFIIALLGAGGVLFLLLIKLEPYRMDRILSFLDPQKDALGISYQVNQALIAIGSGGFWGQGLGESRQKFNYIPEPIGDSIFAVMGEELGFVGAILLITLFFLLALRGMRIARLAPDKFAALLATGIITWISFQALVNIMANVALIPLTGIPLPFVSYGSTALVFVLAGCGILLNISRHTHLKEG